MKNYHTWFYAGINQWSNASIFTALTRIERAIKWDSLKPMSAKSKKSSGAVDTVGILHSVRIFWENLEWPEAEKSEEIVANASGDICFFTMKYFEGISKRIEQLNDMKNAGIFQIPFALCVVLANIEYISIEIQSLILDMCKEKVHDNEVLRNKIGNALKYAIDQSTKLIENSIQKMVPTLRKLLLEGAEHHGVNVDVADRLIVYVEDTLKSLREDFSEKNYAVARECLWRTILNVINDLIQKGLKLQRPPLFYSNFKEVLQKLCESFQSTKDDLTDESLKIINILEGHGVNTANLIHQYYKDRYQMQQQINKSPFHPYGILSIICYIENDILHIDILNAKNLISIGSIKKYDSFVKINIVPRDKFPDFQSFKTKVETDTHFPLFDEKIEM